LATGYSRLDTTVLAVRLSSNLRKVYAALAACRREYFDSFVADKTTRL
jgi:hypothetical protein